MSVSAARKDVGRRKKEKSADARMEEDTTACSACGASVRVGSRFCQECGQQLLKNGGNWLNAQTLTVLGAAVVALAALGLLFSSVIDSEPEVSTVTATSRTEPSSSGQPPDLSEMSPRVAADRLFNRVMMADEQGNQDEVSQFAPMAVAAYERLDNLDLDAVYHLGLIQLAAGDLERAEEAAERLKAAVPEHLLASLLEHRLAVEADDQERINSAVERFKKDYDDEIGIDRPEYQEHRRQIDLFLELNGKDGDG